MMQDPCQRLLSLMQAICDLFGPESDECQEAMFEYNFFCGGQFTILADRRGTETADWLRSRLATKPKSKLRKLGYRFCNMLDDFYDDM